MDVYDYVLQNCQEIDLKNLETHSLEISFYSIIKTKQVVKLGYYSFVGNLFKKSKTVEGDAIFSLETSSNPEHMFFDYNYDKKCNYVYCIIKNNKIIFKSEDGSNISPLIQLPIGSDDYFNYNLIYNLPPYEDVIKMQEIVKYINTQNANIELEIYRDKFKDN